MVLFCKIEHFAVVLCWGCEKRSLTKGQILTILRNNYLHLHFFFNLILQGVIAELTAKHEKTEAQHNKTQRALDCTRTILHKHMGKSIGDQV